MVASKNPKLFDLVAVVRTDDSSEVQPGDVGTIVEMLPPDGLEVEFLDRDGHTRCVTTLHVADILVLNRERTHVG